MSVVRFAFLLATALICAGQPAAPVLSKDELTGRIQPARHPAFTAVGDAWLRKPAAEAFLKMRDAAAAEGITLRIISSTRTFADQRAIWTRKWNTSANTGPVERALGIMTFSSMPGTSRHHWGTDIDLNSLSSRWFNDTAEGRRVHAWLTRRASEFGFCQPYTAKGAHRPTGYAEEKWHWSYRPLASAFVAQYTERIRYADLTGFPGSAHAAQVRSIEDYVNGIDPQCR